MEGDPITWQSIAAGGAAVISSLVGYIVHKNDKRLDDVEDKAEGAATAVALEAHRKEDRETFQKLFEGNADIRQDMNEQFSEMNATMHGYHVDILSKLK